MEKTIGQMIEEAEQRLEADGYADETKKEYRRAWGRFESWCSEQSIDHPDEAAVRGFIEEQGWLDVPGRSRGGRSRRCVQVLVEYGRTGVWRKMFRQPSGPPACFEAEYEEYRAHLESGGLEDRTVYGKLHSLKNLMAFLYGERGVSNMGAIEVEDVMAYAESLDRFAASTRVTEPCELRAYLAFAVREYGLDPMLSQLFPTILSNADAVLPSVYTADEVRAVISSARAATGPNRRRDLAIVMLAATAGMRVSDIKEMRLEDIDWEKGSIAFSQKKGGCRNSIPLASECALALADYIRSERPDVDDARVFLKPKAPFGPYSEHNTFHHVISRLLAEAGIDPNGRHFGIHSLRHSFAVGMLSQKTPYEVISGVLGHKFANTTKRYLRVDVESLRPLCLEVPHVR